MMSEFRDDAEVRVERLPLETPLGYRIGLDWERSLYVVLIILALWSRLYGLEARVQSHDESLHTKYSWDLYTGNGFRHTPLMHGPFLFHATALSYFLFGVSDASARVPVALLGVVVVAFPYLLRRWLGRVGALAAATLLLISPSIAYYSRYIRHDIPVILWVLVALLGAFSYMRDGRDRWLYVMSAGIALMFSTKEVAFIYSAILGVFLVLVLVARTFGAEAHGRVRDAITAGTLVMGLGLCVLGIALLLRPAGQAVPAWWGVAGGGLALAALLGVLGVAFGTAGKLVLACWKAEGRNVPPVVLGLIAGVVGLGPLLVVVVPPVQAIGFCADQAGQAGNLLVCAAAGLPQYALPEQIRTVLLVLPAVGGGLLAVLWVLMPLLSRQRSFDVTAILGTLCLPFLSPLVIKLAGVDPVDYTHPAIYYSGAVLIEMLVLAAATGLLWDYRRHSHRAQAWTWLGSAAIFYAIFVVLFTSVFTNGSGIATGLIGSLGYWLAQQDVQRGGQPWYYYAITVPLYEYLSLLLTILGAAFLGLGSILRRERRRVPRTLFVPFVLWWIVLAWVAYSVAGEKMPWLTVHLALPMVLFSGWLIGYLVDGIAWRDVWSRHAWLLLLIAPPACMALALAIGAAMAGPFRASDLTGLDVTGRLLSGALGVLTFGGALGYLLWRCGQRLSLQMVALEGLLLLVALTVRTAWRFCFVNYDYPNELLVYAHSAPAVKQTMGQIDELSRRVAGGPDLLKVAYGADGSWPFHWYLRDYRNAVFYGSEPNRDAVDAPVVIAGRGEWEAVAPYLGDEYTVSTFTYLWWPAEDYRDLTLTGIVEAISDASMRVALWDIWYDRDYAKYDEVTGKNHSFAEWPLRNEYRLYIRRDLVVEIWDQVPAGPDSELAGQVQEGLAEERWQDLSARLVFGSTGAEPGQMSAPRGLAVDAAGFIYVADAGNNRIQKFTGDGQFVAEWSHGSSPFREPWDVAVATDGSVFVADTWNHAVVKLRGDGAVDTAWGSFGEFGPGDLDGAGRFYGPRSIAVTSSGGVLVSDSGNKRVQGFDSDGRFLYEWGGAGAQAGAFQEPVGIAVASTGEVVVADTWNRRVQVFDESGSYLRQWSIDGWDTGLPDEKPYLAIDGEGHVFVTDPGHQRVLVFTLEGNLLTSFGKYGSDASSFQLPMGIAIAQDGSICVSDVPTGRILVFDPLPLVTDQ